MKEIINWSIGLICSCCLAVVFLGGYNSSLNRPFWSFSHWQISAIVTLFTIGVFIGLSIGKERHKQTIHYFKAYTAIMSLITISWGYEVIERKIVDYRGVRFTGSDAVYHGRLAIGFGLFMIASTILWKIDRNPKQVPRNLICLSCQEPFSSKGISHGICPKCGGGLEDLDGFYERHPELKNTTVNESTASVNDFDKSFTEATEELKANFRNAWNESQQRIQSKFVAPDEKFLKLKILLILILVPIYFYVLYRLKDHFILAVDDLVALIGN